MVTPPDPSIDMIWGAVKGFNTEFRSDGDTEAVTLQASVSLAGFAGPTQTGEGRQE